MRKKKKAFHSVGKILFVCYMLFLVYFLMFSDWYGRTGQLADYHYNLELFCEIKRFWIYRDQIGWFSVFMNLVGNVLIFVPFGFFMAMGSHRPNLIRTVFYAFLWSLCVEFVQLVTKLGSFDVDDLLLNTLGGLLGFLIYVICGFLRRHHDKRR